MSTRVLVAAAVLTATIAFATDSSSDFVALPRPSPQLRTDVTEPLLVAGRNRACESCHADIAREWQASRHRDAFTNEAFQASLAREMDPSKAFCRGCHAPEAPATLATEDARHGIGVACITCHVPLGPVLAGEGTSTKVVPHGLVRTSAFEGPQACASCHEFSFPRASMGAMQRTVSEHARAGSAASCQSCHMEEVGEGAARHKSHAFRGGYDEAFVRGSLSVSARRDARGEVEIELAPRGVTHAVPTGDLFRRLMVEIDVGDRVERRFLARHFTRAPQMVETHDDRVHGTPRVVAFRLREAEAKAEVGWRVVYQRVASHPMEDEAQARIESELEIAHGTISPK